MLSKNAVIEPLLCGNRAEAEQFALLWKTNLGGETAAAPITFQVDGKQYVVLASGNALFAFALRKGTKLYDP